MSADRQRRAEICDFGQRLYARGFCAGNDGNLSIRLGKNKVLCTPTLVSKGFMRPGDLCIVDLEGRLVSGNRPRTSEILLHLEIYRGTNAAAVVHCHPPHATAFAVAREPVPSGILPEVEVMLGPVPLAPYETPGGPKFAATVRPFLRTSNTVMLSNHGTVSWGPTLERAYWNTEILDSYCRMLMLAKQLGHIERLPPDKVAELVALRANFGGPPADGAAVRYVNPDFGRATKRKAPARRRR